MSIIEKVREMCCGSRVMAWVLTLTVSFGLLFCLLSIFSRYGAGVTGLETWMVLSADASVLFYRPWTLLSYMLVHTSMLHLLFNILWLYWFGVMLYDVERDSDIAMIYIGGGLTGGLLYLIASPLSGTTGYLAGNSAAVLSMMIAAAIRMPSRSIGLWLIGEVKLKWVALACIILTLLGGGGNIAVQMTHIGGLACGALYVLSKHRWNIRFFSRSSRSKEIKRSGSRFKSAMKKSNITDMMQSMQHSAKTPPAEGELDENRLDQLLDKIRVSGFDSLTKAEKEELDRLSQQIK